MRGLGGEDSACAAVLQSLPVSCHFRGCKAPLSRIVSGAISSELALPLRQGNGCCETDEAWRSSTRQCGTHVCTSPGNSGQKFPNHERWNGTEVEPIVRAEVGSRCRRRSVEHQSSSVFLEFNCRRLHRIQLATSLTTFKNKKLS